MVLARQRTARRKLLATSNRCSSAMMLSLHVNATRMKLEASGLAGYRRCWHIIMHEWLRVLETGSGLTGAEDRMRQRRTHHGPAEGW